MTNQDGDPPVGVRGGPAHEPEGHAELRGLLAQAIRHLESSDLLSASADLQRACERAASLWGRDGPVPGGQEITPGHEGSRDT